MRMARYRTSVPTAAAPRQVFDYLADFAHTAQWDPGVVEAERLDAGVLKEGSSFRVVSKFGPRRLDMTYRVLRFDASSVVQLRAEEKWFDSLDTISVEPDGDGSVATYDAVLTLHGPARFLDPLLGLAFKRVGDKAAAGLRAKLNELATTPG